jgi:hypothetical protein
MRDPASWPESSPTDFERQLLQAAKAEQIPAQLKLRMSQGLSVPAAPVGTASSWLVGKSAALALTLSVVALGTLAVWATWQQALPASQDSQAAPPNAAGVSNEQREPTVPAAVSGEERATAAASSQTAALPSAAASGEERAPVNPVPGAQPLDLGQEVALLDRARTALAPPLSDAARALNVLDAYARRFAHGALAQEAEALRIEAVLALGDERQARTRARRFLSSYPKSPLTDRITRLLPTNDAK